MGVRGYSSIFDGRKIVPKRRFAAYESEGTTSDGVGQVSQDGGYRLREERMSERRE